ncbi:hypothetical protein ACTXT7_008816 [Hymenolepis weldensis]
MTKNGRMSLKRKFISAGVFKAELDEFLRRELAEDGYSGVKVRSNERHTEIIISATKTQAVLGDQSRRLRELTSLIQKRARGNKTIELFVEKMLTRSLSATTQAESLRYKLTGGLPVRKACYSVLRFIMEAGAKGAEVIVSGKIKGQRAKSMKFSDGLMIHSGDPVNYYIDRAVRHVRLPQGILGIRVKIMLNHDPTGRTGPRKPLPDFVHILTPKEEPKVEAPHCVLRNPAAQEARWSCLLVTLTSEVAALVLDLIPKPSKLPYDDLKLAILGHVEGPESQLGKRSLAEMRTKSQNKQPDEPWHHENVTQENRTFLKQTKTICFPRLSPQKRNLIKSSSILITENAPKNLRSSLLISTLNRERKKQCSPALAPATHKRRAK